jgi:hypothetical protein
VGSHLEGLLGHPPGGHGPLLLSAWSCEYAFFLQRDKLLCSEVEITMPVLYILSNQA